MCPVLWNATAVLRFIANLLVAFSQSPDFLTLPVVVMCSSRHCYERLSEPSWRINVSLDERWRKSRVVPVRKCESHHSCLSWGQRNSCWSFSMLRTRSELFCCCCYKHTVRIVTPGPVISRFPQQLEELTSHSRSRRDFLSCHIS